MQLECLAREDTRGNALLLEGLHVAISSWELSWGYATCRKISSLAAHQYSTNACSILVSFLSLLLSRVSGDANRFAYTLTSDGRDTGGKGDLADVTRKSSVLPILGSIAAQPSRGYRSTRCIVPYKDIPQYRVLLSRTHFMRLVHLRRSVREKTTHFHESRWYTCFQTILRVLG